MTGYSSGTLEVEQVGLLVPGVVVEVEVGLVAVQQERTVLEDHAWMAGGVPISEEQPGPPLSQSTTGSLSGSRCESKKT